MTNPRQKRYPDEFKAKVLKAYEALTDANPQWTQARARAQVAKQFGVSDNGLRYWLNAEKKTAAPANGAEPKRRKREPADLLSDAAMRAEMSRLRDEVIRLKRAIHLLIEEPH